MSKKLYKTSDGIKFYHEQDAKNHALSLEDRKVIEVDSEQVTVDSKKKPRKKEVADIEVTSEEVTEETVKTE